ncbi:hypothetical protein VT84_03510 [Gemmata sp. SH-PL17]|uniref:hypothetical protein n=1 Tax=Gemmata sp. SH-PL17 TaxID=1630693 RepID=UPI00078D0E8D|nr:hypothetical protein [Gemmata sp. SH-PL17]AMV23451.1 hypothetical protein VT84_03510 [Gemmata sp. SH-PL17]
MDESLKESVRNLLKRTVRLLKRITLIPADKPGQLIPALAPADLWRMAPALIDDTRRLAEQVGYIPTDPEELTQIAGIARAIDEQHAPTSSAVV